MHRPTFASAGNADSLIAAYEEYRKTGWGGRPRRGPDWAVFVSNTEALARAYEAKGNTERAAELWRDFADALKNADPELQPRVAAARERLKKLGAVERPKSH